MRSFLLLISAIGLSLMMCLGAPARAYALSLDEVASKDDDKLRQEKWEMREIRANSIESVKCGLWSLLVSTFWRGYGHHCIGDDASHYKLLGMEGASLGMLALGFTVGSVTNDDKALSAFWKTLFNFGTTLFISSYLFDVVGTFKGDAFQFSHNHLNPFGQSFGVKVRWLPSDDLNLGLQLEYTYRNPRFWVSPYAYVDISEAFDKNDNFSAGVDLGGAVWAGEKEYTYVALALDSKFDDYGSDDFLMLKFLPYIEFSLDLGSWFEHMAEFRFINRLGVGVQLFDYKYAVMTPFSDVSTVLVLETEMNLNLFKNLNLAFIYRYRPDYSVGQLSSPSRLYNTVPVPGVGLFSLDLSFAISKGWTADLDMNFGSSIDFWLGISKTFGVED